MLEEAKEAGVFCRSAGRDCMHVLKEEEDNHFFFLGSNAYVGVVIRESLKIIINITSSLQIKILA
jgi:hypothetical protein